MNLTENLPAQEVVGATPPDFDAIRHFDENGVEYWLARELYPLLGYSRWQRFLPVVTKAKEACVSSNINVEDHFTSVGKMVELGSGSTRELEDIALSRYACYLIVQNGDPTKPVIAAGQTYFAIQTRRQEIEDQEAFVELNDDQKRSTTRDWSTPRTTRALSTRWTTPSSRTTATRGCTVDSVNARFMQRRV